MAAAGEMTSLGDSSRIDTLHNPSCGGSQGMEPMHRTSPPDSKGMERPGVLH
jgi:hypothetical protein